MIPGHCYNTPTSQNAAELWKYYLKCFASLNILILTPDSLQIQVCTCIKDFFQSYFYNNVPDFVRFIGKKGRNHL